MLALFAEIDDIRFQDSPPGDTPPVHMLSLWHGEPSLAILTALVQHGADINARDDQGRTFVTPWAAPQLTRGTRGLSATGRLRLTTDSVRCKSNARRSTWKHLRDRLLDC
jgi:hypothetical protein